MREEIRRILKMVEEGKISTEEAVQLVDAGKFPVKGGRGEKAPASKAGWLTIKVYDSVTKKRKVNLSVPLTPAAAGTKMEVHVHWGRTLWHKITVP